MTDYPQIENRADGERHTRPRFPELAILGANDWWRYGVVVSVTPAVWFTVSLVLFGAGLATLSAFDPSYRSMMADGGGRAIEKFAAIMTVGGDWGALSNPETVVVFLVNVLPFAIGLCVFLLLVKVLHRRPARSLLTARAVFHWRGAAVSFAGIWLVAVPLLAVALAVTPSEFRLIVNWSQFFMMLPFALLLIPIQVLTEEVVFRGYLLQGMARLTRLRVIWYLVPTAIFVSLHLFNPEAVAGGAWAIGEYAILSLYLMYLAIRGDGLEYAAGFHLGLNLFALMMVTSPDSLRLLPAIFEIVDPDFREGFVVMLASCLAHYVVVFRLIRV